MGIVNLDAVESIPWYKTRTVKGEYGLLREEKNLKTIMERVSVRLCDAIVSWWVEGVDRLLTYMLTLGKTRRWLSATADSVHNVGIMSMDDSCPERTFTYPDPVWPD